MDSQKPRNKNPFLIQTQKKNQIEVTETFFVPPPNNKNFKNKNKIITNEKIKLEPEIGEPKETEPEPEKPEESEGPEGPEEPEKPEEPEHIKSKTKYKINNNKNSRKLKIKPKNGSEKNSYENYKNMYKNKKLCGNNRNEIKRDFDNVVKQQVLDSNAIVKVIK